MSFSKEFEVRWSDIDANKHLANSAYQNYMSHTRMAFLLQYGFSQKEITKYNIGPVIFYEHLYYFKEILSDDVVEVVLRLKGLSEDGRFFSFEHDFYNQNNYNCASCEMMGAWIDLKTRKLAKLPQQFLQILDHLDKTDDFKMLTAEDTRKHQVYPKNKST